LINAAEEMAEEKEGMKFSEALSKVRKEKPELAQKADEQSWDQ